MPRTTFKSEDYGGLTKENIRTFSCFKLKKMFSKDTKLLNSIMKMRKQLRNICDVKRLSKKKEIDTIKKENKIKYYVSKLMH
jgi:hypothetical protein